MPVLTKMDAVIEMIEGSIDAFAERRFACSVTLAAAAEGAIALPSTSDEPVLFDQMRALSEKFLGARKAAVTFLNLERDWLKHPLDREIPELEITEDRSIIYLFRAAYKLISVYPEDCIPHKIKDFISALAAQRSGD